MKYCNLDYWVLDFVHRPVFLEIYRFGNRMFPSSGVGQGARTLLGVLERDSLNHWTQFVFKNTGRWTKFKNSKIHIVYSFVITIIRK
jgi:hypothetical protein